jgi:hypothetical protein
VSEEDAMTCMHRFAAPVIALVAVGVIPVSSAGQSAFDGMYIARGVDSGGNEYRRAVDIERRGDRFIVTWVSARVAGEAVVLEPTWVGVGLAAGETLSVSFVAEDTLGIAVYQRAADGRQLSGRWTLAGDDEAVYSEVLTKLPETRPCRHIRRDLRRLRSRPRNEVLYRRVISVPLCVAFQ